MCKYTCALLASLTFLTLPAFTFQEEKPKFEVISIKPASPKPTRSGAYETDLKFLPGGKFTTINMPLSGLISQAYEIPLLQVMGIPKSFENAGWNIQANIDQSKYPLKSGLLDRHVGNLMIQSMLEDHFKLKVLRETRILPGYELVIAKGGPRIKLSQEQTKQIGGAIMPDGIVGPSISLSNLAYVLSVHFKLWEGDKKRIQVVDKTGLEGLYSVNLHWTPDPGQAPYLPKPPADEPEITLFDALEEQLGLKLVPADLPTPVVVVDAVQLPTTN